MSFKRRLFNLECRPFRRPVEKPQFSEMDERIRKKLALPLPIGHTPEEFARALSLMKSAQQLPTDDHSGWLAVRDYALSVHRRYESTPYWGWPDEEMPAV